MNNFSNFRKDIGLTGIEISKLTGYTRQGLHHAFNMIDAGRQPKKNFLVCINVAIDKVIQEETKQYEERISQLKKLQEKFNVSEVKSNENK